MPNLRDIKKRINSVQSTKQITRTMEMVAAAKIRRASDRIAAATPYSKSMDEVMDSVAEHAAELDNPLLARREDMRRALVITIVSDSGLAGGFNANVLREVEHYLAARKVDGAECDIIACGKKAISYFKYRRIEPVKSFRDLSADPTIKEAREIAAYAIDQYSTENVDEVVIVYNHARNAADQDLMREVVLPIDTSHDNDAEKDGTEDNPLAGYEYEPSPADVLDKLLPAYVETSVYHALLDSAAAEQGARRRAMKAATDNASDMVTTLNRVYNQARQGAITTEISEIVGGAAALED